MMTTSFWFLGLMASALVVLVYELLFVFPLRRRQRLLTTRADGAEQLLTAATEMARQIIGDEQRIREELRGLTEKIAQLQPRSDARLYEEAINLAEHGAEPHRLSSCFGLTPGEADLVSLLHGRANRVDAAASCD
jgi:Protein of unknown function (DUF2802)